MRPVEQSQGAHVIGQKLIQHSVEKVLKHVFIGTFMIA